MGLWHQQTIEPLSCLFPTHEVFERVENLRRAGRAARNSHIHRHVPVHGPGDGITAFEHAAVTRAITECDDDLRVGRGSIDILQWSLHVPRHWACHDERIRMAGGGGDVNAKTFGIVDGIRQCVHLHFTGVAGACVHLANRQRPFEAIGRLLGFRRNYGRRRGAFRKRGDGQPD